MKIQIQKIQALEEEKEDNTQVENSKEDKNKSQMEIDAEFFKSKL